VNKVFITKDIIKRLRDKLWGKVHDGHYKKTNYTNVTKQLADKFPGGTDIQAKITWCLKAFKDKKGVSLDSEAYETFIVICNELGVPVVKLAEGVYDMSPEQIVTKLWEKFVILEEHYKGQQEVWKTKTESDDPFPIKYTGYYSRGGETPDVSLLRLDKNMHKGQLYFEEDDIHEATVSIIGNHYVFVKLENTKTNYDSLITLKAQRVSGKGDIEMLLGYYCTVLTLDPGGPAAGKMIFERGDNYLAAKIKFPPEYKAQLMHERLFHKPSDNNLALSSIIGNYEGYWFLADDDGLFLRKIAIGIEEDGTCVMIDKNKHEFYGHVLLANEKDHVIKLGFDMRPDSEVFDFRSQMTFELRTIKDGHLDGVYSGQREHWGKVMAGKIRIYATKTPLKDIDLDQINFNDIDTVNKNREKDVMDFFWGIPTGRYSSDFIQPNLLTFDRWFNKFILKDNRVTDYKGKYLLFRQDSTENQVNQYQVTIHADRSVTGTLRLDKESQPIKYSGTASAMLDCLMLNIHLKNNQPYDALYIHFIGPEKRKVHQYFTGVFATIGDVGAPLCGRSVLMPVKEHGNEEPIRFGSKEHSEKDKKFAGLLQFLTGRENNLIKTANKVNHLSRQIQYGDVFFGFACSPRLDQGKRIRFLKYAFEHGFNDLDFLEDQMQQGGALHFLKQQQWLSIHKTKEDEHQFTIKIKLPAERAYTYVGRTDVNA
jgi:hypothetical protein